MTFAEFQTYLETFLWKTGDAVLLNNLPTLIKMADNELVRRLRVMELEKATTLPVTSQEVVLPDDYHSLRDVTLVGGLAADELLYVTPAELNVNRTTVGAYQAQSIYSLQGDTILLSGPFDADTTAHLIVTYETKLPDYQVTDTSWLADNYLDLYVYAIFKHAGMFLREDERVPAWGQMFEQALLTANENSEYDRRRGKPAKQALPYQASTGGTSRYPYSR